MMRGLIKMVIGLMAITWFVKRVLHHHFQCMDDTEDDFQ